MKGMVELIRRSWGEFLGTPTFVIAGFLLLTALMYWLDRSGLPLLTGIRDAMSKLVFGTPDSTRALLGTLATSLITLTSITFSILLIALQQAAASMTHAIVDQFLRRRSNQVFFGFFVGVALYALIILSATGPDFNPVLSGSLALLLGMTSLFLLIVLIYSTIHQVRPAVVIESIHDHTLEARHRQEQALRRTRRVATRADQPLSVHAEDDGFVVEIDFDGLGRAIADMPDAEIEVRAPIGTYVSFGDVMALLRGGSLESGVAGRVRAAFVLDRVRDLANDPAFGIEEMVNIAWTSISTSKQNPAPGRLAILAIRDLLARWSHQDGQRGDEEADAGDTLPIVYPDDLVGEALDALELLAVVCSESMQAQNAALVVEALTLLHPRLSSAARNRVADLALRLLAGLGDHVLTARLESALRALERAMRSSHPSEAAAVLRAVEALARSNGSLNSRSTRVPASGA